MQRKNTKKEYNLKVIQNIKSYVFDYIVTLFYNKDNRYVNVLHSKMVTK